MTELIQQLDLPSWIGTYVVVAIRVASMFLFLPIFGAQMLPLQLRMLIAAAVAFAFVPLVAPGSVPVSTVSDWALICVHELSIGFGLGVAARMIFSGIETAAGLVAGQSGFSLATMVDPSSGDRAAAPALFQSLLAISLFLTADLHHLFLQAVIRSFEVLPPGPFLPQAVLLDQSVAALGMRLFNVAVLLAAPALVVTLAVDLVMVLVGKGMPQVPILMVAYPVKMGVGLVAMWILSVSVGSAIGWLGRTLAADGAALLQAMATA